MKFDRELPYHEIAKLSREDLRAYIAWVDAHRKQQQEAKKEAPDDWLKKEYTLNNYIAARREHELEEEKLEEFVHGRLGDKQQEQFTYFWETSSPFSQWHRSSFVAPSYIWNNEFQQRILSEGFEKEYTFSSAEQYMMYCKAMLFTDLKTAKKILKEDNPRKIKALGREVQRFQENTWYVFRWRIVYGGNKLKFTGNQKLKEALFATRGTTLVEAAPNDNIWGIGLAEDAPEAQNRKSWKGKNLLGEILTELRTELMG
ncbi:MAG: NADAR family protein, partial [Bacteroidota bacterium]